MTSLLQYLEEQERHWQQIDAEEVARLRQGIAEAVREFGPHLLPTWSRGDSPEYAPRFGRAVKLVYVGEFTYHDYFADKTEPERIYTNWGEKVILYLGEDYELYAYEAFGNSPTRTLGIHRLDMLKEERARLDHIHELLISTGLY